jgi:hypothetical protein
LLYLLYPLKILINNELYKFLPCLIEVIYDLHCSIKIKTNIIKRIKVFVIHHIKKIAQNNVKYRLILKCFSVRNAKFTILSAFDRFAFPLSSNVSRSPLAFLKNTSVGIFCEEFDDINDDSTYIRIYFRYMKKINEHNHHFLFSNLIQIKIKISFL